MASKKRKGLEYHSSKVVGPYTRKEAFDRLARADHGLITEPGIKAICEAFGVTPIKAAAVRVDPREPKGLNAAWDDDGKALPPGSYIFGLEASLFASLLCESLKLEYPRKFGRGFQLRACLGALEAVV